MATVRGNIILSTVAFVEARFGRGANQRVLERLSPECARTFVVTVRESQRGPIEHVLAYMQVAQELLAPGEEGFFRQMGSFAGQAHRDNSAFAVMVTDRETAARMAPVFWRTLVDEGRMEVARPDAGTIVFRLMEFRSNAAFCERALGSVEALLRASNGEHTACVLRGDGYCEFKVSW